MILKLHRTIKAGNSWKPGQDIPRGLLTYRTSDDGSCFPNLNGTDQLFATISNYPLLRAVVFLRDLDTGVFSNAVTAALTVGGPTRFFADVVSTLEQKPELVKQPRFKVLKDQARIKHVVVDSLYISYADMSPEAGRGVLGEIKVALEKGRQWSDVYREFADKQEYSYKERLSDGTVVNLRRSKIGNLGDFVLAGNGDGRFFFREFWMPKQHIPNLFDARPGQIVILFDKEDLSRFPELHGHETGERQILYQIREVFPGR